MSRAPLRLLVVDDSPLIRAMVRDMLDPAVAEVAAEAGSGEEGLEAFRKTRPDLVLLDLSMPEMDGMAFLEALRDEHPEARVVLMTANTQQATARRARDLKAAALLYKPFEPEQLRAVLRRAAAR